MVQARRTSSNLLEPHHCIDGKGCRVPAHAFGVVRLYRTFSNYIFIREARCAWCFCTRSASFNHIEPPRTVTNYIIIEMARCVEFLHMSSGWFGSAELSLTTSVQWKHGVQGAYALGRRSSTTPNLLEPSRTTSLQRWQSVSSSFTGVRGGSTLPKGVYALVRGTSNLLEPSRTTSLQRWQGVSSSFT